MIDPTAAFIATNQPIKFLQPTMRQNHSNYSAPINIESPVGIMPFGRYKGTLIWLVPMSSLMWIKANMRVTELTVKTFNDVMEMGLHVKEFAVLRRFSGQKWHTRLQGIYSTQVLADTHCNVGEGYEDFVYYIVEPKI